MGSAIPGQTLAQKYEEQFVSEVYRGHEFDLAVDPLPPLPFFAGGKELFPG
jgi:hypothetical protein